MLEMSPPAGALWMHVSSGISIDRLAQVLGEEFGVQASDAAAEAAAFISSLASRDLVSVRR